jgi:hypothetical protein
MSDVVTLRRKRQQLLDLCYGEKISPTMFAEE